MQQENFFAALGLPETSAKPDAKRNFDPSTLPTPTKRGVGRLRFGTSSWTYPGWNGPVYRDVAAYGARFSQLSLCEYARDPRFRTAGADNLYYVPPAGRRTMLERLRAQAAEIPLLAMGSRRGFDLCPKVWHGITVHRYTRVQQTQFRLASEVNRSFLDPVAFLNEVLLPLREGLGPALGPMILEIQENDLSPAAFVQMLDRFLCGAGKAGPFSLVVELRTQDHFTPAYLDVLRAHGVGHVMNAWTRMPQIGWQHAQILAHDAGRAPVGPRFVRALLNPGEVYDEAVAAFAPYTHIVRRLPQVRADILRVIGEMQVHDELEIYVIVNNRLEGHAPATIHELLEASPLT